MTGVVPRISIEQVLPQTWVEVGIKDGLGCDAHAYVNHHFTAEEVAGKPQPDQHWHEHATCFRLGDRGLVVISSCGHAGIVKHAEAGRGVEKIYALVGGFHLAPAPEDYLRQVMAEPTSSTSNTSCPCIAAGRILSIWPRRRCQKNWFFAGPVAASRLPPSQAASPR